VSKGPLIRKVYTDGQPHATPLRIQQALLLIGLPPARVYASRYGLDSLTRKGVHTQRVTGFWQQREDVMQALADDMRLIYHAHIAQVHPDHGGTHEAAALLVQAFTRARQLFRAHGIVI